MSIRVLVVEDNDDYRDLVNYYLKSKGFEVIIASNGVEAVEISNSEKPHIILMDLNLPIVDGWEATKRLKADARTAKIPVMALTAHAMSGDRERALAAGCDEFDTKPIDFDRLIAKMRLVLEKA